MEERKCEKCGESLKYLSLTVDGKLQWEEWICSRCHEEEKKEEKKEGRTKGIFKS